MAFDAAFNIISVKSRRQTTYSSITSVSKGHFNKETCVVNGTRTRGHQVTNPTLDL